VVAPYLLVVTRLSRFFFESFVSVSVHAIDSFFDLIGGLEPRTSIMVRRICSVDLKPSSN
jgi:hypothetical protein